MERLGLITINRNVILEKAARVCFERAAKWSDDENALPYNSDRSRLSAEYRLRRDEADQCRFAVRRLKLAMSGDISEMELVKDVAILMGVLADTFGRQEYKQGFTIFSAMYLMMSGEPSWPFPMQPCTPPFQPTDVPSAA